MLQLITLSNIRIILHDWTDTRRWRLSQRDRVLARTPIGPNRLCVVIRFVFIVFDSGPIKSCEKF